MSVTGRSQQAGQLTVGRVAAIGVWDAQGRPVRHPLRLPVPGQITRSCGALIPGSTGGLT
jgi:ribosomal protein S13